MAVNESAGLIRYKDKEGNMNILLPITTKDNVDGIDDIEASLSETIKFTKQTLTDSQKAQARDNLGIEAIVGYTHPETHPASMIEGLSEIATDGRFENLLNKPFFDLPKLETTDIAFTQFEEGYSLWAGELPGIWEQLLGETYKITWDGVEYTCVCKDASEVTPITNVHYFGNVTKILGAGIGEDTGEPFAITINFDTRSAGCGKPVVHTDDSKSWHTMSLTPVNPVKKIDTKYLPEGYGNSDGSGVVDNVIVPETVVVLNHPEDSTDEFGKTIYANVDELYATFNMLEVGVEYKVVFEGTEYILTSYDATDLFVRYGATTINKAVILGNGALFIPSLPATGEPFAIGVGDGLVDTSPLQTSMMAAYDYPSQDLTRNFTVSIAQEVVVGGSTGSSLPAFTTEDEGKVLSIKDGALSWESVSVSGATTITEVDVMSETDIDNFAPNSSLGGLITRYISFNEDNTDYCVEPFAIELGEKYTVVWDDEVWEDIIAVEATLAGNTGLLLGNGTSAGLSGNGEPFAIAWQSHGVTFFSDDPTATSHKVRIYQKVESTAAISWNDLADKPFGGGVVEIFSGSLNIADVPSNVPLHIEDASSNTIVIGNAYTVNWNGVEYRCVCEIGDGLPCIGNVPAALGTGDNDMPFLIARDLNGALGVGPCWLIMPLDGTQTVDITISSIDIKYLDNKYLEFMTVEPDTVIVHEDTLTLPLMSENTSEPEKYIYGTQGEELYSTFAAIEAGKTYKVVIDGEEFTLTAKDLSYLAAGTEVIVNKAVGLGNMSIADSSLPNSGESFFITVSDIGYSDGSRQRGATCCVYGNGVTSESKSFTFSLTQLGGYVIDPAYLPSGIGSGSGSGSDSSLPEVSTEDAGKFLRVGADGSWIVEAIQDVSEVGL